MPLCVLVEPARSLLGILIGRTRVLIRCPTRKPATKSLQLGLFLSLYFILDLLEAFSAVVIHNRPGANRGQFRTPEHLGGYPVSPNDRDSLRIGDTLWIVVVFA